MYFSDAAMYNQQAQQYVLAAQLQQQQGVIQQQQAQQAAQQVSQIFLSLLNRIFLNFAIATYF